MIVSDAGTFCDYFERIRERTRRVFDAVPAEKWGWTYREGKFTFADIARHLGAIERWMYGENVRCLPSRYPGHGPEIAAAYNGPLAYLDAMHAEAMPIFRALTAEDLARRCETPGGATIPVAKWLRAMVEHEAHHRGQVSVYLGMLGLPSPPMFGLTSEEVRSRSVTFPNRGASRS
ncbi:MAG TPA: DinB family protein [Thermoanaerobaculia bacterium]